ncbi:hypothetical protein Q9295_09605 [Xinfangfangia sp. CPCC 101601]|uniref:SPOR domain-containing protein n=1 Tax=Pseudogemmobacter lacusdianii TaxID=3069608 RepID=A0ABU0W0I6_9RHOB|nr:hypothetical protein [Xinfangfangia sp. CPCC 101601]MDQ2066630.1 hypothetical protein [Xinfangfangia sp. CPCC 101601]
MALEPNRGPGLPPRDPRNLPPLQPPIDDRPKSSSGLWVVVVVILLVIVGGYTFMRSNDAVVAPAATAPAATDPVAEPPASGAESPVGDPAVPAVPAEDATPN